MGRRERRPQGGQGEGDQGHTHSNDLHRGKELILEVLLGLEVLHSDCILQVCAVPPGGLIEGVQRELLHLHRGGRDLQLEEGARLVDTEVRQEDSAVRLVADARHLGAEEAILVEGALHRVAGHHLGVGVRHKGHHLEEGGPRDTIQLCQQQTMA